MPVLTDILKNIHAKASVYFCDHLEAPWNMDNPEEQHASFHYVRQGQCVVECEEHQQIAAAGDIIFLPKGSNHTLRSLKPSEGDTESRVTLLLCGYFKFDQVIEHPLLSTLPSLVLIRAATVQKNPSLHYSLDFLLHEFNTNEPGSMLILDKLTDIVFIQLVRTEFYSDETKLSSNFSKALFDKKLSQVLRLMHTKPETNWTLESLASQVGLSRTSLAAKFKQTVGTTMFTYLTQIRIQKACNILATTSMPVYLIAEKVGYQSELSFRKTFKNLVKLTPSQYRKQTA